MKKYLSLLGALFFFLGCSNVIEKPDNLIPEDKMVDILHDLYVVEGIRQSNPGSFQERELNASAYVYKKYKIDSLQFAKSDKWYASDIVHYGKMYEKIKARIEKESKDLGGNPNSPATKKTRNLIRKRNDHFLRK